MALPVVIHGVVPVTSHSPWACLELNMVLSLGQIFSYDPCLVQQSQGGADKYSDLLSCSQFLLTLVP